MEHLTAPFQDFRQFSDALRSGGELIAVDVARMALRPAQADHASEFAK
ncbi:MAG: hypothetical protein K0U69_06985 [Actinomycetia bacterium]|nr:hypothetical protein [Actinomycetes bacterium]MCH9709243.1 hypothetical protein [Actinomycetes bacterium]